MQGGGLARSVGSWFSTAVDDDAFALPGPDPSVGVRPRTLSAWGHRYLGWNEPAIAPRGESVSNTEMWRRLAAAFGMDDPFFDFDGEALLRRAFFDHVDLDQLRADGFQRLQLPEPLHHHADRGAEPCVEIDPDDAASLGIVEGTDVRVFNDRGSLVLPARFTGRAAPPVRAPRRVRRARATGRRPRLQTRLADRPRPDRGAWLTPRRPERPGCGGSVDDTVQRTLPGCVEAQAHRRAQDRTVELIGRYRPRCRQVEGGPLETHRRARWHRRCDRRGRCTALQHEASRLSRAAIGANAATTSAGSSVSKKRSTSAWRMAPCDNSVVLIQSTMPPQYFVP